MFRSNGDVEAKRISNNDRPASLPCKPGNVIGPRSVNPAGKNRK